MEDPTDNKTRDTGKITTLEKSHVMDIEDDNEDTIESVSIDEDKNTGELLATTTRIVKGPGGSKTKIKTTEKFSRKNGKKALN